MDHVTSGYILGQKKRLEAERRYSHGLLLTVIRSYDYLPENTSPVKNQMRNPNFSKPRRRLRMSLILP